MEDFKKLPKMQSFKEGGFVTKKELKREEKGEEEKDVVKDKKIVKKAFSMHDKQSHEGEKTDLSKLKKGGRAKKEKGTVKKFCGGGMPKKAEGGIIDTVKSGLSNLGTRLKHNVMGTPEQNAAAKESNERYKASKKENINKKKGGKIKKYAEGGNVKSDPLARSEKKRKEMRAKLEASLTPDQLNQLLAAQKEAFAQMAQAQQPAPMPQQQAPAPQQQAPMPQQQPMDVGQAPQQGMM
jgi:hypothetical protein